MTPATMTQGVAEWDIVNLSVTRSTADSNNEVHEVISFCNRLLVEVAGVEPASLGLLTSLLRAQLGLISPFCSSNEANGFFYLSFP